MKKLLVFFFILVTSISFAALPCKGLCGFNIGEKLDVKKSRAGKPIDTGSIKLYIPSRYTKFLDFESVFVGTNSAGEICIVTLSASPNSSYKAFKLFDEASLSIESRYQTLPFSTESKGGYRKKTYKFPNDKELTLEYKTEFKGYEMEKSFFGEKTITPKHSYSVSLELKDLSFWSIFNLFMDTHKKIDTKGLN